MNQKGSTLIEVIVSFVIIVIITQAVITSFLSSERLKENYLKKENIICELNNISNLFTSDPDKFVNNLSYEYDVVNIDSLYYLYYDKLFNDNVESSNYYIVINYYNIDNLYTIELNVYQNNIIDKYYNNFKRSIYI